MTDRSALRPASWWTLRDALFEAGRVREALEVLMRAVELVPEMEALALEDKGTLCGLIEDDSPLCRV